MKVQISLDDALVERMDRLAQDSYMSRSSLISVALTQYLNANEVMLAIRHMSMAFERIAVNGDIDDETKKELEVWQNVISKLYPQTK